MKTTGSDHSIDRFSRQLLEYIRNTSSDSRLGEATENAFLAVPRHLFVRRYRQWGTRDWHEVGDNNLQEHLATIYADRPLCLFGDDDDNPVSTISQPSFVLRMLDMLQLRPGQIVLELGAGSGWNAALIGYLVGPPGHVYSVEIIPDLAAMAAENVNAAGLHNVTIVAGEGGEGYAEGGPYDRAVFTAGSYDLPSHFYKQMKEEGLLLLVVKSEGGGDNLFLLQKKVDHFESIASMPCGFVQLRGKYELSNLEPGPVEELAGWSGLGGQEVCRVPFWWGWKGNDSLVWRTLGFRCFLSITEPLFRTFKEVKSAERPLGEYYFGLWDQDRHSLALAKGDSLIGYGNSYALDRLRLRIREWVDLGMPSGASFTLHLYPADVPLTPGPNQWIVKRRESQFLWSLPRT